MSGLLGHYETCGGTGKTCCQTRNVQGLERCVGSMHSRIQPNDNQQTSPHRLREAQVDLKFVSCLGLRILKGKGCSKTSFPGPIAIHMAPIFARLCIDDDVQKVIHNHYDFFPHAVSGASAICFHLPCLEFSLFTFTSTKCK